MNNLHIKKLAPYIYDKATGSFSGFMIGLSASGLTSWFFETRSIRNLWGLTAKKTLVSKQTYGTLEWVIAALVGYLVFEVFMKLMKEKAENKLLKRKVLRWLVQRNTHTVLRKPGRFIQRWMPKDSIR